MLPQILSCLTALISSAMAFGAHATSIPSEPSTAEVGTSASPSDYSGRVTKSNVSSLDIKSEQEITVAAYYFGNYHSNDPRNQKLKGPGWSEWELVKAAKPRFRGHRQPRIPLWGYLDESDPKAMELKIKAASDHGIDVFIFDWYYYDDGPFLQGALNEGFLKAPNNYQLRFSLMWANHDWLDIHPYKRSGPAVVLFPGRVSTESFDKICDHVIQAYFSHPSYWKINGRPYFSFYDLSNLLASFGSVHAARSALDRFRSKARTAGLIDLHLNAVVWGQAVLPGEKTPPKMPELIRDLGFDSVTSYVWTHHVGLPKMRSEYDLVRDQYLAYWDCARTTFKVPYIPNATIGWDASPRADQSEPYTNSGYPFMNTIDDSTPDKFKTALKMEKERILREQNGLRIININSWNEWTEGSYLEPDTTHGMRYLEAVRDVFAKHEIKSTNGRSPARNSLSASP